LNSAFLVPLPVFLLCFTFLSLLFLISISLIPHPFIPLNLLFPSLLPLSPLNLPSAHSSIFSCRFIFLSSSSFVFY
jgi:hypothetical protein